MAKKRAKADKQAKPSNQSQDAKIGKEKAAKAKATKAEAAKDEASKQAKESKAAQSKPSKPSKPSKSEQAKSKPKPSTLAERADRFDCYQRAVQSPEHEVEFFEQAYRDVHRRKPLLLREDFCGTFAVCCEWVKSDPRRKAVGVDLCGETLQWGREHNLAKLTETQAKRVRLLEQDVRKRNQPHVDVLAAQNFSFWIFKTRPEVIDYFKIARANLNPGGILVMDMMGGGECYNVGNVDKRKIGKGKHSFRYDWEQGYFNPVNADCSFYIHFKFKDGSKLRHAFEYHWRFWTLPEVLEMLREAGFSETHTYWEQEDANGEDTGEWKRATENPSHPSWLCYVVAVK
ncbi:MAG: class I SAM-dependent methyltransferase [Planctomycetales bacterium]|nr:class I SAM-dependent methyltransferase [Planctomycetales bacterium]